MILQTPPKVGSVSKNTLYHAPTKQDYDNLISYLKRHPGVWIEPYPASPPNKFWFFLRKYHYDYSGAKIVKVYHDGK